MKRLGLVLLILAPIGTASAYTTKQGDQSANESAIRKTVAAYVEAFNKRDAKALADYWSPDAVYRNRTSGEEVTGRAAIADQFSSLLKSRPNAKLEVNVNSIQFISPGVAVESGSTKLVTPNTEPEETDFTAVMVKRDEKWLIDRVTEKDKENAASHYEQLKVLEWMVGQWTADSDDADVELDCNWTKNQNFMTRTFKISIDDDITASGMQIIGWDPAAKSIRSWTFDSKGAFAEATWERKGNSWFIRNRGNLPDGRAATMINVMKQIDENSFTWQTIERTAGNELLPNIDEIRMVRR